MKRKREQARQEKRREKATQRANRAQQSRERERAPGDDNLDPDIAHIVPGPQAKPWDDDDDDTDVVGVISEPSTTVDH